MSLEKNNLIKIEQRSVIKFLTKEGNTPSQIKQRMPVFGDSCPSDFTIKFWARQFKAGRESLEDNPRSGRPISAITEENVTKVKNIILEDRRVKQWEIARDVGISKEREAMASTCEMPRSENVSSSKSTEGDSNSDTSDISSSATLTIAQKARIERQRQKARALHDARLVKLHPAVKEAVSSVTGAGTTRARDTGGGFLLEDDEPETKVKKVQPSAPVVHESEQPHCLECDRPFPMSYLFDTFDYSVCDECRNEETHSLITRTEAKTEFLLKDCDLDKREPPLKCIRRRNPHKAHYSDMRLYLRAQVEARALEVWGSEEALEAEHEARVKRREKAQETSTKRRLKELRMASRSSLFEGRKAIHGHTHEWGDETYDEDSDSYTRVCKTCGHSETYEKM